MGHDDSHVREFCHVGDHSRPTPILRTFLFKKSRCLSLSAMEEAGVVRIVESSFAKKNETLLASTKFLLDRSLTDLKRSHEDTTNSHPQEIKKLKFEEHHRLKKKGNEDQYSFNLKVADAIDEAKEACSSQNLDKVHASLKKGEKLLSERQKRIILADKSDCDWSLIREYRK